MAQHIYSCPNESGAAYRADMNNALAAIVSQNSGAAAPGVMFAYMWWADTTTGLLKRRDSTNSIWITIGPIDQIGGAGITNTPSGGITETNVQAALNGLDTRKAALGVPNTWTKAQGVAQVALADAANIATDASLGNVFNVTLGGNRTLQNPTNLVAGFTYIWHIGQDGTGNRTLAYGNIFKFPSGVAPVLSITANAKDSLQGSYDGVVLHCTLTKDFR